MKGKIIDSWLLAFIITSLLFVYFYNIYYAGYNDGFKNASKSVCTQLGQSTASDSMGDYSCVNK